MGGVWARALNAVWDEGREPLRSMINYKSENRSSSNNASQWEVYDMGRWMRRHCVEMNLPPELINIIAEYSIPLKRIMPHAFWNLAQKPSCAGCRFRLLFSRPSPMPSETELCLICRVFRERGWRYYSDGTALVLHFHDGGNALDRCKTIRAFRDDTIKCIKLLLLAEYGHNNHSFFPPDTDDKTLLEDTDYRHLLSKKQKLSD